MTLEPESTETVPPSDADVQNQCAVVARGRRDAALAEKSATKVAHGGDPHRVRVRCSVCGREQRGVVRGGPTLFWAPRKHGAPERCAGSTQPAPIVNGPEIPADPRREEWASRIAAEPDPIEREFQQRLFAARYGSADHHEKFRREVDAITWRYIEETKRGSSVTSPTPTGAQIYE